MGRAGGAGWSEVPPRSLDCTLGITGGHNQVVGRDQEEEAGLEEGRGKQVPQIKLWDTNNPVPARWVGRG